jgi:hypothetical protein
MHTKFESENLKVRHGFNWKDKIKMGCEGVGWILVAQDGVQ